MTGETILLIDDDPTLLTLLGEQVRRAGYEVQPAASGPEGLRLAAETDPALIVLDVMMPGMDGWQVCRRLRERSTVPIIMLTAKDQEFDKLRGFHLGVDDYVTKPFSFAELVARIGAVLSRARRPAEERQRLTSGELAIDFDQRRVTVAGRDAELSPTEYRLLVALARRPGRTIPAETLLLEIWGPAYAGEVDHVKHYVWSLRQKIEADPGNPRHILTARGFGYRFE